MHIKNLGQK